MRTVVATVNITIMNMKLMSIIITMRKNAAVAVVVDIITTMMKIMNIIMKQVEHEPCVMPAGVAQKTYILENLGCANCAAKMERKIQALPEVEGATLDLCNKKN